tara:strand:- start:143505 stop:144866 length:1362 start_codon:yes stop_codon:yes gene_type:complete
MGNEMSHPLGRRNGLTAQTLRERLNEYLSLQTLAAIAVAFLIFGGRFGIAGNPQSSGLSAISDLFHENFLQIRWWLAGGMLVLAAVDFSLDRRPRPEYKAMPLGLIGFALMVLSLFISMTYAGHSDKTVEKGVDLIILSMTVLGVHYWASRPSKTACDFGRSVLFFCLILGVMLSLVAVATADLSSRLAVGDGGPNTFVRIVGVTALAALGLQIMPRPLSILLTLGLLTLVVLTQSRGGLLACVAGLGLVFVRTFGWRAQIAYLGSLVTGLACVALFTKVGRQCVDIVTDRFINKTFHDGYTAGRDEIYEDSISIWMESPFFGHGLASWWDRIGTYPHNIFLELGCDAGIVAVVAFTFLMSVYALEGYRCRDQIRIVVSSACLLYFVAAQFSGDIYDSRSLFIFGTILVARRGEESPNRVIRQSSETKVNLAKQATAIEAAPNWSLHPSSRHH